jgi:hypothetical protein
MSDGIPSAIVANSPGPSSDSPTLHSSSPHPNSLLFLPSPSPSHTSLDSPPFPAPICISSDNAPPSPTVSDPCRAGHGPRPTMLPQKLTKDGFFPLWARLKDKILPRSPRQVPRAAPVGDHDAPPLVGIPQSTIPFPSIAHSETLSLNAENNHTQTTARRPVSLSDEVMTTLYSASESTCGPLLSQAAEMVLGLSRGVQVSAQNTAFQKFILTRLAELQILPE